jgi:hypothetical protein
MRLRFLVRTVFFYGFWFIIGSGGVLEITNSLADAGTYFRQFAGTENNDNDDQNNDQFRHSQTKHGRTSLHKNKS